MEEDTKRGDFQLIEATTWDNAENLPQDFLDSLRELEKRKPELYKRFVLNDWTVAAEGKVFKGIRERIKGEKRPPKEGEEFVIGVDLGKYQDFTVLTPLSKADHHLCDLIRFKDISWNIQKKRIVEAAGHWNDAQLAVDFTGIGDPIVEDLIHAGCTVLPYKFTNTSKEQLVEKLAIAIEQGLITYPEIAVLIQELEDYEMEITPAGNYRYHAPEGRWDDCVTSLMLALWGANPYHLEAIVEKKDEPKFADDASRRAAELIEELAKHGKRDKEGVDETLGSEC